MTIIQLMNVKASLRTMDPIKEEFATFLTGHSALKLGDQSQKKQIQ